MLKKYWFDWVTGLSLWNSGCVRIIGAVLSRLSEYVQHQTPTAILQRPRHGNSIQRSLKSFMQCCNRFIKSTYFIANDVHLLSARQLNGFNVITALFQLAIRLFLQRNIPTVIPSWRVFVSLAMLLSLDLFSSLMSGVYCLLFHRFIDRFHFSMFHC